MSSGLECVFFEPEPAKWYYALQDDTCPVGAWDWREYASCYGPFPSKESADRHLSDNHCNPGAFFTDAHSGFRMDKTYEKLIKEAVRPLQGRNSRPWGWNSPF